MSRFIKDFEKYVRQNGWNLFHAVEVRNGVTAEVAFLDSAHAFDGYSVAKAFVVTAVGLLYDDGKLKTEDKICDLLGEECPADTLPVYRDLTVDQTLKHRIGLPKNYLDIDTAPPETFGRDFLRHVLTTPPVYEVGTTAVYTDAAYYLLSRVVEAVAKKPIETLLWERIFTPLGFREAAWSKCPMGHAMGATGLFLHTKDVAKLGVLYLGNGEYKGNRLLSEAWVKTVLEREYEFHPILGGVGYGKGGMYGQQLMVVPEKGRVVAWHGSDRSNLTPLKEWVCRYKY